MPISIRLDNSSSDILLTYENSPIKLPKLSHTWLTIAWEFIDDDDKYYIILNKYLNK